MKDVWMKVGRMPSRSLEKRTNQSGLRGELSGSKGRGLDDVAATSGVDAPLSRHHRSRRFDQAMDKSKVDFLR
jgi:hypothetical protein